MLNIRVKLVPAALPAYMACFGASEKSPKKHEAMERDGDTCRIALQELCENRALS